MAFGLQPPNADGPAAPSAPVSPIASPVGPAPQQINIGGIMSVKPLSTVLAEEATDAAIARASEANNRPVMTALAQHIRADWDRAKLAKRHIEVDMIEAVYSRRGEYTPEMLAQIQNQGGSAIYMMLFATKARQAKALLTDVLIGAGTEKPWTITPTPKPTIPQQTVAQITMGIQQMVEQAEMSGVPMSVEDIRQMLRDARAAAENAVMEFARSEAERAEVQIEDVLVEGDYLEALDQFIDDLMVFKTAFIKRSVEKERTLEWSQGPDGVAKPTVAHKSRCVWKRVDPMDLYPAKYSRNVNDGPLIERHRLTRGTLYGMIGVEGYSEDAIRAVLDAHGTGGLHEWLQIDVSRAAAEGRRPADPNVGADTIDALQYWGSVSGKTLLEWGMGKEEVPDEAAEYEIEAWLVGEWVIKAIINPDPLNRRPYYADGYSRIPGAFWHNSLYDLLKDCQGMCNAAARALSNNMGISSGPQVVVNTDRLPPGEEITDMYPWKLWQTTSDPMGSSAAPISFFQPSSNANELMGVYEKFASLADEYSGIPRYMTGTPGDGGAGRTASGMSMMIGNASKQIKQLVSSIDIHVINPMIKGQFDWMMQYDPEANYQGDLKIVARGALSLTTKEAAQVRRNEFLQQTANPVDLQIIGMDGRAEVLRQVVKSLDMNPDKIVPSASVVKMRAAQAQAQQMALMQAQQPQTGNGQELMNGAPTTDHFQPSPA